MKNIKDYIKKILLVFRPTIWKLANLYDIKINMHCIAQGQNPLIIEEMTKKNIPKSVYFNTRSGKIIIGSNTVFGEDVQVLTGKHYSIEEAEKSGKPIQYVPLEGRDIFIGNNCYIGGGAILIGPIVIEDYAVIGAGSVVTKSIPSRCFAAGVPAKIIKQM